LAKKKAKSKLKRVLETNLEDLKSHALNIEKNLLSEVGRVKEALGRINAKIEDSKLTVDVNDKGEIEVEFSIKALIKGLKKK